MFLTLIFSFILAIGALTIFLGTLKAIALWRLRRMKALRLRPNCLMTRSPLVFITGYRSLLYFMNYWNSIPSFLKEHGYEVRVWNLPWRHADSRLKVLQSILRSYPRSVHLIADSSNATLLNRVLLTDSNRITSVTSTKDLAVPVIQPTSPRDFIFRAVFRAHLFFLQKRFSDEALPLENELGLYEGNSAWRVENVYLDRAVQLAEAELVANHARL